MTLAIVTDRIQLELEVEVELELHDKISSCKLTRRNLRELIVVHRQQCHAFQQAFELDWSRRLQFLAGQLFLDRKYSHLPFLLIFSSSLTYPGSISR